MDQRPEITPDWAYGPGALVSEPELAKRMEGWVYKEPPPSSYMNWIQKRTMEFLKYLDTRFDSSTLMAGRYSGGDIQYDSVAGEFQISDGTLIAADGQIFTIGARVYDSWTLNPHLVGDMFRFDAIKYKIDYDDLEGDSPLSFAYHEDIASNPDLGTGYTLFSLVAVVQDVAYNLYAINQPGRADVAWRNSIVVSSGNTKETSESPLPGIYNIQESINHLAEMGGGRVILRGDWFGDEQWDAWNTLGLSGSGLFAHDPPIRMKSGVVLEGDFRCLIRGPNVDADVLLDELIRMTGAKSTCTFPDTESIQDLALDFYDFGHLSVIQILSGVNAGWYLIKQITSEHVVTLCSMSRADVTITAGGGAVDYVVYIANSGIRHIRTNSTEKAIQRHLMVSHTFGCHIHDMAIQSDHVTDDCVSGIDLSDGYNYGLRMIENSVNGCFECGIFSDPSTDPMDKLIIVNNDIDVSSAHAASSDGIIIATTLSPSSGIQYGNSAVVKGAGTTEQYPAGYGLLGLPFSAEHESDTGYHTNDFIDTLAGAGLVRNVRALDIESGGVLAGMIDTAAVAAPILKALVTDPIGLDYNTSEFDLDTNQLILKADSIVPAKLADRVPWLLACISSNSNADAVSADAIMREVALDELGVSEAPVYLGAVAFDVTTPGTYPWNVRKNAVGNYQIRPPCTIIAGPIIAPKYDKDDVTFSILTISVFRMVHVTWNAIGKIWDIFFADKDEAAADSNFQITFMKNTI
ncbi:MAG: hypothetical protein M0Q12_00040 [Synergistaceae bacterium]|jgi:hypothetical protein|nr:hypothetical protein [Synergistaceae bacterium]